MGSSNKASKAAERAEQERKAAIERAQARVDQIFGSPERRKEYERVTEATRGILQSDLDKEKRKADLQTKFAVARGGLSGGSVDIDKHADLSEQYLRGIVEAERRALGAGSALERADAESKANLQSMILGGLDVGRAGQQAQSMLQQNVGLARNQALEGDFSKLFGDLSDFWKTSKESAGERRAGYDFGSLYGSRNMPSGGTYGGF